VAKRVSERPKFAEGPLPSAKPPAAAGAILSNRACTAGTGGLRQLVRGAYEDMLTVWDCTLSAALAGAISLSSASASDVF
jgi:hypothetical protein